MPLVYLQDDLIVYQSMKEVCILLKACCLVVVVVVVPLETERTCEPKGKSHLLLGQGSVRGMTYPFGTLTLPLLSSEIRKERN